MSHIKQYNRRRFLKTTALGAAGVGLVKQPGWPNAGLDGGPVKNLPDLKIKEYRTLGRTGFRVSDLATGSIQDEGLLGTMLDCGVNYIDTAESYPGHHRLVGRVLKNRDRKTVFVTSKMEPKGEISKEGFINRTRKALREIDTEYLDCMMMHCPEKAETVKLAAFHEAMQELKAEGRVRFVGISNHGSFWFKDPEETMARVLLAAAEDGRFDVFLLAYNFLQMDQGDRVLKVCQEKNIGTTLMKTNPISKYYIIKSRVEQLEKEGKEVHVLYREGLVRYKDKLDRAESFIQQYELKNPEEIGDAAIRFVLGNPLVHSVCCSLKTYTELERVVKLSGTRLTETEEAKLAAYREGCGELYCRHACGICEPSCPHGVPVNTIMRYQHYYTAQGREDEAIRLYASIPGANTEHCGQCAGYCEEACPFHIPIRGMLITAQSFLGV